MSQRRITARLRARLAFRPFAAAVTDKNNEDQEFPQGAEGPPSREPHGSPQGPHLHHQQVQSALQGTSGLICPTLSREFQFDLRMDTARFVSMRFLFAFCLLALLIAPPATQAAEESVEPAVVAGNDTASRLDQLFGELKRERNEKAAERIAGRIWHAWLDS